MRPAVGVGMMNARASSADTTAGVRLARSRAPGVSVPTVAVSTLGRSLPARMPHVRSASVSRSPTGTVALVDGRARAG